MNDVNNSTEDRVTPEEALLRTIPASPVQACLEFYLLRVMGDDGQVANFDVSELRFYPRVLEALLAHQCVRQLGYHFLGGPT